MSKIYTSIGLMSGTSLDGIDVALIKTDGEGFVERGPSATYPYEETMQSLLHLALRDAGAIENRQDRPGALANAESAITEHHIKAVHAFTEQFDIKYSNIDVIGFHGQTVLHKPAARLTVQIGDGAALARVLDMPVVYDMRAADVAAGGQGAPLVPAYHRACAKKWPVAFLNIGGVANVTYIGETGELLAFDTGPGNALINDWVQKHTSQTHDAGGQIAAKGKVFQPAVEEAMAHQFFQLRPPKSLDRNSFAKVSTGGLSLQDGAATLTAFTVQSIAAAQQWFPTPVKSWIICGGGRHNAAIMQGLKTILSNVQTAEDASLNGDSMEAEAWAYLAVRSLRGLPLTFPGTTGVASAMTGGILMGRSLA